ncbi:hypothetical protein GCM10009535_32750 [Streptomyces thermocarboxydovorans]|uniref:Uncharacterized protein n=1 Tax=Streptomyces thermocarboxydovorans TaxID=59298 RepID=A0ABN1HIH3_9ACTN
MVSATPAAADQGAGSAHAEFGDSNSEALRRLAQPPSDVAAVVLSVDDGEGEGSEHAGGGAVRGFTWLIKPKFLAVSSRLLNMLSKYLTLKEWSLQGEIIGGIPLLAMGKASLTLTFGP